MNQLEISDLASKFGSKFRGFCPAPESPPYEWKKMTLLDRSEKQKTSNPLRIRGFDSACLPAKAGLIDTQPNFAKATSGEAEEEGVITKI